MGRLPISTARALEAESRHRVVRIGGRSQAGCSSSIAGHRSGAYKNSSSGVEGSHQVRIRLLWMTPGALMRREPRSIARGSSSSSLSIERAWNACRRQERCMDSREVLAWRWADSETC